MSLFSTSNTHFTVFMVTFVAIAVLSFVVLCVIAYRQAHRLTYSSQESRHKHYDSHPELAPTTVGQHYQLNAHPLSLVTADGLNLSAHYTPSRNGAAIILSHGYKMNSSEMIPIAALFAQHGYGVLLQDQRAHGMSAGEQISFGRDEWYDLEAAVNFLEQQLGITSIGLFGNSMGGALSLCYAARDSRIKAVIAQSPYASIGHSIKKGVKQFTGLPAFPFAPLVHFMAQRKLKINSNKIAPLNAIAKIHPRPVLLLMGGQDHYVEPQGIFALHHAAGDSAELWYEHHLDHVEFHEKHPAEFERQVMTFYAHHLLNRPR
jgi:pimeloyl-ACP methyl ester carboxylesterase